MFRILVIFVATLVFQLLPAIALANISVSPLLIDHTVEAREMLEEKITITNQKTTPVRLFASVNEITLGDGGVIKSFVPASVSDNSISVTSWIAISRGRIEIPPGGSVTLPVKFQISPAAVPGVYQAYIGFANGSNRDDAEKITLSGQGAGVVIRLKIEDTKSELLRLQKFVVDRFVTSSDNQSISFSVANPGDTPINPDGEVIIYDSRGAEVTSVKINIDDQVILPGEVREFTASIDSQGLFGKYKAFLQLEYGAGQKAAIYDTTFFFATPPYLIITIFLIILCIVAGLIYLMYFLFHRNNTYDEHEVNHVTMTVRNGVVREKNDYDISLTNNKD